MLPKKIKRTVTVEQGTFEGIPQGNPAYTVFKGVPYAKPPVGEWRFRWAQPAEPFKGVRKCDTFPPTAVQDKGREAGLYNKEFFPAEVEQSEDCLYLNIWTPSVEPEEPLPVMFWIHGGAFSAGYSYEMEMDGEAMSRRGVILVTVTYRLGALGFFAHPELSRRCPIGVSGNMAVSDCIEGLKWVKKNIAAFGGDPENVTVFGQSAGGAMVQVLLMSPASEGLFRRAIVQSAGGINTLGGETTMSDLERAGEIICEGLGKTIDEVIAMDAYEFNNRAQAILAEQGMFMGMAPCVDGVLLKKAPGAAIAAGEHHKVDIMTGSVSGDGALFGGFPVNTKEEHEALVRRTYGADAERVLELFGVKSDADVPAANKARARVGGRVTPYAWAIAEEKNGRKPLHIYYFDRHMPGVDDPGAFHSSELWYIFGTIDRCWRSLEPGFGPGDYVLSRAMTDYWTNFARTGDPNGVGLPRWDAFTAANPQTMYLNEKSVEQRDMTGDRVADGLAAIQVENALGK